MQGTELTLLQGSKELSRVLLPCASGCALLGARLCEFLSVVCGTASLGWCILERICRSFVQSSPARCQCLKASLAHGAVPSVDTRGPDATVGPAVAFKWPMSSRIGLLI